MCEWTVIAFTRNHWILSIHSNFTNKNVSWLLFSWATQYAKLPDVQQLNVANHVHCHLSCHGPGLGWIIPWCCWSADLEQVAIFHVFEDIGYFKRLLKTLWFVWDWDCSTQSLAFRHTHTQFILMAIFPGEPGLADCSLNSPSPFIPGLRILLGQA